MNDLLEKTDKGTVTIPNLVTPVTPTIAVFSEAQKKALREYDIINTIRIRPDFDEDGNPEPLETTYGLNEKGTYDRPFIKFEFTTLDKPENSVKGTMLTDELSSLGIKEVHELSGKFAKVTTKKVSKGDIIPFTETVYENSTPMHMCLRLTPLSPAAEQRILQMA